MRPAFDAVIIGAGVIGCSSALEMSRRGLRVAVVDGNSGPGNGTTSFSSAICRVFYSVPDAVRISWEAYQVYSNWQEHVKLPSSHDLPKFRECGAILLRSPNSVQLIDSTTKTFNELGIKYITRDFKETQKRVECIGWDVSQSYVPRILDDPKFDEPVPDQRIEGSIEIPSTGYISDPRLATQNLHAASTLSAKPAQYYFGSRVVEVLAEAERVVGVKLANGLTLQSPVVLNAAGPHSSLVNKMVYSGRNVPPDDSTVTTRPLRVEVAYLPAPPGIDLDKHGVMTADFEVGVYMRPEFGNRLLVGGIEPPCDELEWVEPKDIDNISTTLGEHWKHNVYRAALRIPKLPIPSDHHARGVASMYDATPDWSPIIDKSALRGYYNAIGTSGNCFKKAPVIGQAVAELVIACENGLNHDVNPLEVKLTRTNSVLKLGSFSRKRSLHATTGSVIG
eukprot:PhF_6_TR5767/c0_g1_i1/m.8505